jgi:hypothetical protein
MRSSAFWRHHGQCRTCQERSGTSLDITEAAGARRNVAVEFRPEVQRHAGGHHLWNATNANAVSSKSSKGSWAVPGRLQFMFAQNKEGIEGSTVGQIDLQLRIIASALHYQVSTRAEVSRAEAGDTIRTH